MSDLAGSGREYPPAAPVAGSPSAAPPKTYLPAIESGEMVDGCPYVPGVNCIECGRFVGRDGWIGIDYFEMFTPGGEWPSCYYDPSKLCGDRLVDNNPGGLGEYAPENPSWHIAGFCECPSCPVRCAIRDVMPRVR